MKVWLVIKSFPYLDLVDDDLRIHSWDVGIVESVRKTRKNAEDYANKLREENRNDIDADPIEVTVVPWEVEE